MYGIIKNTKGMGFKMNKDNAKKIIEILKKTYPDAKCSLNFNTPFELLIAVMLSAQCTDERVNKTTPNIFCKYNTPADFANIDINELEQLVHPCGFYKNKAKNIKETSKIILEKYDGQVPKTIDDLISLPGVGKKTANVIMLEAFNMPQGVAVDTHCKRLANRLGISKNTDPEKIEQDILALYSQKYYKDINHIFIYHGRKICKSRSADCENCPIKDYCDYEKNV